VWEHALGAISRYEHRGVPFAAWLYRIAGNLIANHFRRARLRQFVPFMGQVAVPDSSGRLDDRDAIRQALRELSVADQEVLALHYFAGLTPPEISGVLGCAVPVVHKRLQRARERLRVRFEGDSSVTRA
jgi:RNA polymerase sigma-70 factor (ECF subfamily)